MNLLNFSNNKYKTIALNTKPNYSSIHTPQDAFFLLINDIEKEDLINLCYFIKIHYKNNNIELSLDECYNLTQNMYCDEQTKLDIYNLAKLCAKKEIPLGRKLINNKTINTSEWINHSLNVSEACYNLAKFLGLNKDTAETLGLLHDYGRKYNHSFSHTIIGFEKLVDLNWTNEAFSSLTHSFIKGQRCANNEPAIEGFYIDENGNPNWKENAKKDDIREFLENYMYSEYDTILTIADLMATSKKVMPPHKRIEDIKKRRIIDPTNRIYFLKETINLLIEILETKGIKIDLSINNNTSIEEIESILSTISDYFYYNYNKQTEHTKKLA